MATEIEVKWIEEYGKHFGLFRGSVLGGTPVGVISPNWDAEPGDGYWYDAELRHADGMRYLGSFRTVEEAKAAALIAAREAVAELLRFITEGVTFYGIPPRPGTTTD